jgi:SMI1 / KNR4 family (SUKH-1)
MSSDNDFIAAIVSARGNDAPREEYANWLEARRDPRSGYVHAEKEWAKTKSNEAETRLRRLAREFDAVWAARVSRPPMGICADHVRFHDPGHTEIRPALTQVDLAWLEKRFGITLSPDYQAFLLNYNGGRPEPGHYRLTGRSYDPWRYENLLGLGAMWAAADSEIDWWEYDVVWNLQEMENRRLETTSEGERWRGKPHRHLMAIGFGPPDGLLEMVCLGCGGDVLGQVFLVTPGLCNEDDEDYRLIAPSFAAFLGMLTDYDPDHVKAIKVGDVEGLRRWLDAGGKPNEYYHSQPIINYGLIYSQPAAVRELLTHRAEIHDGLLMQARQTKNRELIDLLQSHCRETLERVLSDEADPHIRFGDLRTLLSNRGFIDFPVATHGSVVDHYLFWRDGVPEILNLQPRNGMVKPYQVKQVREILTRYGLTHAAYTLAGKINIEEDPVEPLSSQERDQSSLE